MPIVCQAYAGPYDGAKWEMVSPYHTVHLQARLISSSENHDLYTLNFRFVPFEGSTQYWLHTIDDAGFHVYKPFQALEDEPPIHHP